MVVGALKQPGGSLGNPMQDPPRKRLWLRRRDKATRLHIGSYVFQQKGLPRFDLRDPYHLAITLRWPQFFAAFFVLYLGVNLVFATLYWLAPGSIANAQPNSFLDALFFSVETLGTVGYGDFHPATTYAHAVATAEIVCGLAVTAILTGLIFVRFSRPRAKLSFAANPVVAIHNGTPTLMVRIGNGRAYFLMNASAKLNVLLSERSAEGRLVRRAQELRLQRSHLPVFPLTWTLMHVLDERSPLFGYDEARTIQEQAQLFVTFEARDPAFSTVVHDLYNYAPEDIRFGMRYTDAVVAEMDGATLADLSRIGDLEPDTGDRRESGWSEIEEN